MNLRILIKKGLILNLYLLYQQRGLLYGNMKLKNLYCRHNYFTLVFLSHLSGYCCLVGAISGRESVQFLDIVLHR